MDVGAAAGTLEKAGNQDFVGTQYFAAYGADPIPVALETVNAAFDVHESVFAAVKGREGQGAYQFAVVQFCGADRAGLGLAGHAYAPGFNAPASVLAGYTSPGRNTHIEKKGITKPEQYDSDNNKNEYFQNLLHTALAAPLSKSILKKQWLSYILSVLPSGI